MKYVPVLMMLITMAVVVTADGVPTKVTYVSHDTVSAIMAKVRGPSIINDKGLIVLAQRRAAGEVEYTKRRTTCSSSSKARRRL